MKHRSHYYLVYSILTTSLLASMGLSAQQSEDDDSFSRKLEEVIVTARKREETMQEVPFSIAAATELQIQERGLITLEDVSRTVAGFTVQNLGPGQSQIAIRGASAGQIVRDQPGVKEEVGVYLDESVISLSLFTPDLDLYDMNRVEILRGPQGTLYGSGSLSGTVKYITNQPDPTQNNSAFEVGINTIHSGGTGGTGKGFLNAPVGDSSAIRLTVYYEEFGGWIDARQPDGSTRNDINGGNRWGARLAWAFAPNDDLTITPRIIYQNVKADGWNREDAYNILANPFTTTRPKVFLDKNEQYSQFKDPFTDEFTLIDLNIIYDMNNDMTLTSITSYTDRKILAIRDATALTASITGGSIGLGEDVYILNAPLDDITDVSGWTQELRISGGDDSVIWLAGLFYSSFDRDYGQHLLVPGFTEISGIPTQGDIIAPEDGLFWSDLRYDFDQLAFFGEATWSATETFDLTGGLRYYDYDEKRIQTFDGIFAAPGTSTGKTKASGWAPRLIGDWKINDEFALNAQVSKGFRLGGINDPLNIPLCTPSDLQTFGGNDEWDDEVLWNYEVGFKSEVMNGRGIFNIAVFYQDIKDLQATVTAGSCSSRVVFNVPKAHSQGIELEFSSQATDRFDFAITASYIEASLDSTVTSTAPDGTVSVVGGIEDGNRLATVPKFQGAIAANYVWPQGDSWEGYTNAILQYVSSRYTQIGDQADGFGSVNLLAFDPNNIGGPLTQSTFNFDPLLPSYTIVNARLGWRNDRWDVSLYANNIFDEHALLALDQERGTLARVGYLVNQPRTYGITLRARF